MLLQGVRDETRAVDCRAVSHVNRLVSNTHLFQLFSIPLPGRPDVGSPKTVNDNSESYFHPLVLIGPRLSYGHPLRPTRDDRNGIQISSAARTFGWAFLRIKNPV